MARNMSIWRRAVAGLVALFAMLVVHTVSAELTHPAPAAATIGPAVAATQPAGSTFHGPSSCPGSRQGHDPVSPDEARAAAAPVAAQQEPAAPVTVVSPAADLTTVPVSEIRRVPSAGATPSLWVDLCVMRL